MRRPLLAVALSFLALPAHATEPKALVPVAKTRSPAVRGPGRGSAIITHSLAASRVEAEYLEPPPGARTGSRASGMIIDVTPVQNQAPSVDVQAEIRRGNFAYVPVRKHGGSARNFYEGRDADGTYGGFASAQRRQYFTGFYAQPEIDARAQARRGVRVELNDQRALEAASSTSLVLQPKR